MLKALSTALADNYPILIIPGAAILGGNTLYPLFLRLTIWVLSGRKYIPSERFENSCISNASAIYRILTLFPPSITQSHLLVPSWLMPASLGSALVLAIDSLTAICMLQRWRSIHICSGSWNKHSGAECSCSVCKYYFSPSFHYC